MNIRNYIYSTDITIRRSRLQRLYVMLVVCMVSLANTFAQETAQQTQTNVIDTVMRRAGAATPTIIIGGDVYGGGLEGKVGIVPAEGQEITADQANTEMTSVTIANGKVRTVFGGGKNGQVYGKTTVSIKGGLIGDDKWEGTPYGGVYGGGEGSGAIVHGHTEVTIDGGENYNNVYGGGKQALLKGNSNVTLKSGVVRNRIFAGARMANINGYGFVNVVGDNTEGADMLIARAVYGGNDISGNILNSGKNKPSGLTFKVEQGLPEALASFVFTQSSATNVFIGNVFGGGNGDYKYDKDLANDGKLQINLVEEQLPNDEGEKNVTFNNLNKPEADYAYLQIEGGTFGNIYGGGNNATILKQTDIYYGIDDAVIKPLKGIPSANLDWLNMYEGFTKNNATNTFDMTYNAFRIFGGNNLEEMSIRPKWHLKSGTVGNIYSGGNKGKMTNPNGIILTITSPDLKAHNVYGGCRMADVEPKNADAIAKETYTYHSYKTPEGNDLVEKYNAQYEFKEGYAARVLITDGKINNLYGGNDISGKVHFGTNVELRGAISGDVYGGGNGSYAYTDKEDWIKAHPEDADYYYIPGVNSIESMYNYRPHVEKTLLHITGIGSTAPPVYVTGGVYCGGNSATLAKNGDRNDATATFEIGKHVIINSVFLGSNGENMLADDILQKYTNNDFSSIKLTDNAQFAKYMEAVAVNLRPTITWEWDDDAVPGLNDAVKGITNATEAYIGAFYCGGNVGSMTTPEQMAMDFPKGLTIFDRIVGGCNSAKIAAKDGLNAAHDGGVTTAMTDGSPKVVLNIDSRLEPRRMVLTYADGDQEKLFYSNASTEINTDTYQYGPDGNKKTYSILHGANVYGGCYESGQINGDVEINVRRDIVSPDIPEEHMVSKNPEFLKDAGLVDAEGNVLTNVPFAQYAFSTAMNVFGGGYGKDTEIKGMTTINLTEDARVMKVFGGGEMGIVRGKEYTDNGINMRKGSLINISATKPADATKYNTYMAYGGGYEGKVFGDVEVHLNSGRLFDVYGGSCNADIEGSTFVNVGNGVSDVLEIKNSVYGANDFGGQLLQAKLWTIDNGAKKIRSRSHVVYNNGAIENELFGGSFGSYDYNKFVRDNESDFKFPKQDTEVVKEVGDDIAANTFVQVSSMSTHAKDYVKNGIYGGGRGFANAKDIVDVHQTYVHLHSATYNSRFAASLITPLTPAVYGGGYYSKVENTLVDAVTGHVGTIYGGTAGMTATLLNKEISYNAGTTNVNIHSGMDYASMIVYGAGPLAGANTTNVNLYGGVANKVYGGSFAEGICNNTNILVPEGSTVSVYGLYGGSRGKQPNLPCDVIQSNIYFHSDKASVTDAIFGGNDFMRATKHSFIDITVPVKNLKADTLINVYAAGDGAGSLAGYTRAELSNKAEVRDIYGGGRNGLVLNAFNGTITNDKMPVEYQLKDVELTNLNNYYSDATNYLPTWDETSTENNTNVHLIGGQVKNIYGGGFNGDVTGNTEVKIGNIPSISHEDGCPTVLRSAYGGGQLAAVIGNSNISLYDGYIGYKYVAPSTPDGQGSYLPNLKISPTDELNLLDDNGNLYGGGYDEGGFVHHSFVNIYGGVVRNSVYGGGEIAAIGEGEMESPGSYHLKQIIVPGSSNVYMYDGLVERNVFGGGRGFSYNESGGTIIGKKRYTDGFTFGKTNVEIYRGEVGTDASVALGHGNVFGGGNVGFVYSGHGKKNATDGYYYDSEGKLTEDCRVVVSAYGFIKNSAGVTGITVEDNDGVGELLATKTFKPGELISTPYLNLLPDYDNRWNHIDQSGVVIHNAVFAGGNVSIGDDKLFANTYTVYGNCTASVIDTRFNDLVALGDHEVGGLYGDGNLTLVDGYRELNITNYGSDYFHLEDNIPYDKYQALSMHEKEYYELSQEYLCKRDFSYTYIENGETITKTYKANENNEANIINETVYNFMLDKLIEQKRNNNPSMTEEEARASVISDLSNYFEMSGLCKLLKGRMMNTIQRADFCGMFGSRLLLKGALDRVINVADNTKYTINRVGELSLNQDKYKINGEDKVNGNYFGIYSIVNYLGALTSDVKFTDIRVTDNDNYKGTDYGQETSTYKAWKQAHLDDKSRNIGKSQNTVALASGVYLELVKEPEDKKHNENIEKDYGLITGIIGLDLINVSTGEGGGFVYADNKHGEQEPTGDEQITLAKSNKDARSNKAYRYKDATSADRMQSSGNFVNDTKLIIDDCFPGNNSFYGPDASPAHMWYIRGDHYVYDIIITAYTGAAQSYDRVANTSLNVTAGSDGRIELKEIGRNRYALFAGMQYKNKLLTATDSIVAGNNVYYHNDPINYWEWSKLTDEEKIFFTSDSNIDTYICNKDFTIGEQSFTKGEVITHEEYVALNNQTITDEEDKVVFVQTYFNTSNAVSRDNGFLLTLDISNPAVWDNYYQELTGNNKQMASKLTDAQKASMLLAPTFKCTESGLFGQKSYKEHDLINETLKNSYEKITITKPGEQAEIESAYIAKKNITVVVDGKTYHYVKGACMSQTHYNALSQDQKQFAVPAYVCMETVKMNNESGQHYIYGVAIPKAEYEELVEANSELYKSCFEPAYICTVTGYYGGKYFEAGKNYIALDYCGVNPDERSKFEFNQDAFDLLRHGFDLTEDSEINMHGSPWNTAQRVDYKAIFNGAKEVPDGSISVDVSYINKDGEATNETITIKAGMEHLDNNAYEALPNEQARYSKITIGEEDKDGDKYSCYIIERTFFTGDKMYRAGAKLTTVEYNQISTGLQSNIKQYYFDNTGDYYYCHEEYKAYTDISGYHIGQMVPVKTIITQTDYDNLKNYQQYFLVQGSMPRITSTLYVVPEVSISDLEKERIVTAVYEYRYKEFNGISYENVVEKHIVNIHVDFESGAPSVGRLMPPATILPGQNVAINKPGVERGAYEVLGGNWEMYTNQTDAQAHTNGQQIQNGSTPLFWYQNGYWVAYYAESYLGRTYSNAVQLSIANYHDINNMMNHVIDGKHEYLYVDEPKVMRNSKIYIDDRECTDNTKSELDLLYDFYMKTQDANELNEHVKNGANLDFHINSDVTTKKAQWQPIGDAGQCFEGSLHGNGHTIYGLDHSLFGNLCGKVYNLGVTGSFNGGGISDNDGTVTNSWINTTATDINAETTYAVIGNGGGKIINSYYPDALTYKAGEATPRPYADFLKGNVTFDLNRYYLEARKAISGNAASGKQFSFIKADYHGTLDTTVGPEGITTQRIHTAKYSDNDYETYVETLYGNEDFIYSNGTLPLENDIRLSTTDAKYYPIYPDDYIFFGQTLNYNEGHHNEAPTAIQKDFKRMLERTDYTANRVYRAPAYRRSSYIAKDSASVYFNRYAAFASQYMGMPVDESLTAIDFTGNSGKEKDVTVAYSPLLDYEGLAGFATRGITQNLLVYADARDIESHSVLLTGLPEPALEYGDNNCVLPLPATTVATVNGHLVDFDGTDYTSPRTHFLVDKQNYNAPIAYSYTGDNAMWYQRKPETFIDIIDGTTHGWDAVSLPFTAGMVTTNKKGDITHFYGTEDKAHEYWLRAAVKMSDDAKSIVFNRPTTDNALFYKDSYETENSFLYSYYYQYNDVNDDSNTNSSLQDNTVAGDNYGGIQTGNHGNYYNSTRTYTNYLYLTGGVPYIIGFPGEDFYEFDMSGKFQPDYSSASIPALDAQTVTYISLLNEEIPVSDEQTASKKTAINGYAYTATYQAQSLSDIYTVNASGTAFEPATATVPFRPYLAVSSSSAKKHKAINISYEATAIKDKDINRAHGLRIYAKNHAIHIESYLEVETDVNIYNTAGVLIRSLRILPGEQRQVSVASGIYIVNRKKLSVK